MGCLEFKTFFFKLWFSECRGTSWGGGKGGVACCSGRGRVSFWCSHCVTCQRERALEFILRTSFNFRRRFVPSISWGDRSCQVIPHRNDVLGLVLVTWVPTTTPWHDGTKAYAVPRRGRREGRSGEPARSAHDPSPERSSRHRHSSNLGHPRRPRSGLGVEITNLRECLTVRRPVRACNARAVQNQLWVKGISKRLQNQFTAEDRWVRGGEIQNWALMLVTREWVDVRNGSEPLSTP